MGILMFGNRVPQKDDLMPIDQRMTHPPVDIVSDFCEGIVLAPTNKYYLTKRKLRGQHNDLPKMTPVTVQCLPRIQGNMQNVWYRVTVRDYDNIAVGHVGAIRPLATYHYVYGSNDPGRLDWAFAPRPLMVEIALRAISDYLAGVTNSNCTLEEYEEVVNEFNQLLKQNLFWLR